MTDSSSFSERLAWARRKAGFDSPRGAAEHFGWNENTYKSRDNGIRGVSDQGEVRKYARAFDVEFIWLLTGEGTPKRRNEAPVMGLIGPGGDITPAEGSGSSEGFYKLEVCFPLPEESFAFEVSDNAMYPRYEAGDAIICWNKSIQFDDIIGFEAILKTANGKHLLKTARQGVEPATFDLESHNAAPIRGVRLEWASLVRVVIRSGLWTKIDRPEDRRG